MCIVPPDEYALLFVKSKIESLLIIQITDDACIAIAPPSWATLLTNKTNDPLEDSSMLADR